MYTVYLSMTPCTSLPAQPQEVSTLCSCTLYIHLHVLLLYMYTSLHDTFFITTCTTTEGKYSPRVLLLCMYMYISLHTSSMTPCPSLPAQPQEVSTLFSCALYVHVHLHVQSTSTMHVYLSMTPCPSLPAWSVGDIVLHMCTNFRGH